MINFPDVISARIIFKASFVVACDSLCAAYITLYAVGLFSYFYEVIKVKSSLF